MHHLVCERAVGACVFSSAMVVVPYLFDRGILGIQNSRIHVH